MMEKVISVRLLGITAVLLLLSCDFTVKVTQAVPFSYEGNSTYGPSHWPMIFPNYCNGSQQSPIDIITQNATPLGPNSTNLNLTGYNNIPVQPFQVLDSGHSVQVNVMTKEIKVTGASLMNATYTLEQLHFHWGATSCNQGSEHRLNGKPYPEEIHLVHYNSDLYASFADAVSSNNPTAVTVFSVFVDVAAGSSSRDLDAIISNISRIPEEGNTVNLSSFAIQHLMPCTSSKVYTYRGSLTTPNCSQVVVWNVFEQPIYITLQQLAQFRTVKGEEHVPVVENYRPVQPLNGRVVNWFNVPAPSDVTSCYTGQSLSGTDCMTSPAQRVTTRSSIGAAAGIHSQTVTVTVGLTLVAAAVSRLLEYT